MNKKCFRVIFNQSRDSMMVVAENVKTQNISTSSESTVSSPLITPQRFIPVIRPLAFAIMSTLGAINFAHAEIIADQAAPISQQPTISTTDTNIPLVNIQPPSAAGVSRNIYSQFNVETKGAIINNALERVHTELGGWIDGNNNFTANEAAKIILNEVNSSDPSLLNGYTEIAGVQAQFILANPSGIDCNGCGFINASRLTLTTGTPQLDEGNLIGFRVGSAAGINILGSGLDSSSANYTDLLSRFVAIQTEAGGGIFANNLNVVTGTNEIDVNSQQANSGNYINTITPIGADTTKPSYALDVAALGGMYSGTIYITGTEANVGVKNAGKIRAKAGELTLDADGNLSNSGVINTEGRNNNLDIKAQGLDNSGVIASEENADINIQGDIENTSLMTATRELKLVSSQKLSNNDGTLTGQRLEITAEKLDNSQGTIQQTGDQKLTLKVENLHNNEEGLIGNIPLDIDAPDPSDTATTDTTTPITTTSTTATTDDSLSVAAAPAKVLADGVVSIETINNKDGNIIANGLVKVEVNDSLQNSGTLNINDLRFKGESFDNRDGDINTFRAEINTQEFDNTWGTINVEKKLTLTGSGDVDNSFGLISAQVTDIHDENAADDPTAKTQNIINSDGILISRRRLSIDSKSLTSDGNVLSEGDLYVKLLDDYTHEEKTKLQANDDLELETAGDIINQGQLSAGKSLSIKATNIDNTADAEISANNVTLETTEELTNRGLIDSTETVIVADEVSNLGTGRIYGDHIAIEAKTLTNEAENDEAAVIAARDRLDIGATNINNSGHALLFSAGDMKIGGELDESYLATEQADSLINNGATIEALGDIEADVASLKNLNAELITEQIDDETTYSSTVQPAGSSVKFLEKNCEGIGGGQDSNNCTVEGEPVEYVEYKIFGMTFKRKVATYFEDYTWLQTNATTSHTEIVSSDPALFTAGGNITIKGSLTNKDSSLIAGGVFDLGGSSFENIATQGQDVTSYEESTGRFTWVETCGRLRNKHCRRWRATDHNLAPEYGAFYDLPTTTFLENTSSQASNVDIPDLPTSNISQLNDTVNALSVKVQSSSLFNLTPDTNANYFIETDSRFANFDSLSSDYLLEQLSIPPDTITKRLGDGFYEQKLVRDRIKQLTGKRFLEGYQNDEVEYRALIDQGVSFANNNQLVLGTPLSDAQIAELTNDIVWLIEKEVTLPDGTRVTTIVPEVYLYQRPDIAADPNPSAGVVADNVIIDVDDNITNSGSIIGNSVVSLTADNIENDHGKIKGEVASLNAKTDIINTGGSLEGEKAVILNAGNDITIETSTTDSSFAPESAIPDANKKNPLNLLGGQSQPVNSNEASTNTTISNTATLEVSDPNGVIVINAGNDVNLVGADVTNSGEEGVTVVKAKGDINLRTVEEAEYDSLVWDARNYDISDSSREVGTKITTEGDIHLIAEGDINVRGADVTSESGRITAVAWENFTIEEANEHQSEDSARYIKKSGVLSSSSTTTRDSSDTTVAIGSNFSGEDLDLRAGEDFSVQGSTLVATNDVNVSAGENVNIESAEQTSSESHYRRTKKSGIYTNGGASITVGSKQDTTTSDTNITENLGSTIGSIEGDVNVVAGQKYNQTGSDLVTPQGNINVTAKTVDINAAIDSYNHTSTSESKQSGLTVAVSNSFIDQGLSYIEQGKDFIDKSDNEEPEVSGRLEILEGATTALKIYNGYDTAKNFYDENLSGDEEFDLLESIENVGDKLVESTKISISIGKSESESTHTETTNTAQDSQVVAGGNVSIKAVGGGVESDLTIKGSQISGENIALKADDSINLVAEQNIREQHDTNESSSGSIGLGYGVGTTDVTIEANYSEAEGKRDSKDIVHTNTHVNARNEVVLESGGNTSLTGAVVTGEKVIADISGDFNIESVQDTSTYNSEQRSVDVGVVACIAPACNTNGMTSISLGKAKNNVNGNFNSVVEQSGIKTGDGGFDINVDGNTDLNGGVISSTENASENNLNNLTTGTISTSDITNNDDYDASGYRMNAQLKIGGSGGVGQGDVDGHQQSTTESGISSGNIKITKEFKQNASAIIDSLNRSVSTNNDTSNSLTQAWDGQKLQQDVETQIRITKAFTEEAPKALATYATNLMKDHIKVLKKLENIDIQIKEEPNLEKSEALKRKKIELEKEAVETLNTYENWREDGIYRKATNIIIAALGGNMVNITSAVTKESLAWAAGVMREYSKRNSKKNPGIVGTDGLVLSNISGESEGVYGDNIKLGGTRLVLDLMCGEDNSHCETHIDENGNTQLTLNEKGQVQLKGSMEDFLKSPKGKKMAGLTGGIQGSDGTLGGSNYESGSSTDRIIEHFAGVHDVIGGTASGLYDNEGNATRGRSTIKKVGQEVWTVLAIGVSAPFALSTLVPASIWDSIATAIFW